MEGANIIAGEMDYCSNWVANNVQKFKKHRGVSLEGMKNLSFLFFFFKIEKMKLFKETDRNGLKRKEKIKWWYSKRAKKIDIDQV